MEWDGFRYFLAVAKNRTLKKAARELRVDQATAGRRISSLQSELGVHLLEKRSDGYFLTSAGHRIFQQLERVDESFAEIHRLIAGDDERVEGIVKIAMPGALANQWAIEKIGPLLAQHPKLEVQFLTGAEIVNLSRREADLAIRLVRPSQNDLKTRKLGHFRLGLYGVKRFSNSEMEYAQLPFIGLFDRAASQLERDFLKSLNFTPMYRMRSAAWSSVYSAIKSGLGIGILPVFMGEKDKSLVELKRDRATTPLWLVVHPDIATNARVRVVIDFFTKIFSLGSS